MASCSLLQFVYTVGTRRGQWNQTKFWSTALNDKKAVQFPPKYSEALKAAQSIDFKMGSDVLTGNLLKDPGYTLAYHQGSLSHSKQGREIPIEPRFGNKAISVPPDPAAIQKLLDSQRR